MKYFISYFAQLKKFTKDYIPLSTAHWDPKWFHDNKGPMHYWIDNRGVLMGLRLLELSPNIDCECVTCKDHDPSKCNFVKDYYEAINKLDFDKLIQKLETINQEAHKLIDHEGDFNLVLMVYETPTNPCSERSALIRLFKEHGIELEELSL